MRFSFDLRKSKRLRANPHRGIGFEEVCELFSQPYWLDRRSDVPEQFLAVGWVSGRLYSVIYEVRQDEEGEILHLVTLWKSTYPANLCPLLWGAEFAEFGSDFGEPVCQSIEDGQNITGVGQGAPKHFQDMLGNLYSLQGAGEVGVEADIGLGRRQEMPGLGASGAELML